MHWPYFETYSDERRHRQPGTRSLRNWPIGSETARTIATVYTAFHPDYLARLSLLVQN